MLLNQRRLGRTALAVSLLIALSEVAGRTGFAAAGPAERLNATSAAPNSTATFHTFDIEEVFSNADGSVQFIELRETAGIDGNVGFAGNQVRANTNVFTFPVDLPGTITANRFVLIATVGFAALPGAVTPDYVIPQRFFEITGDTITIFQTATNLLVDTFSFGATFLLPTDGVLSLNRDGTTGTNSPTNFAGETGSVNTAPPVPALSRSSLVVLMLLLVTSAAAITRKRRRDVSPST